MGWTDWIPESALQEVREMKRAPVAVAVLLVVGFAGGWVIAKLFFNERIEVMQLQINALERGLHVVRDTSTPSGFGASFIGFFIFGAVLLVAIAAAAITNKRGLERANIRVR